ncbi:DUF6268 family outer membrane beta-barrel protein [Eisenibacter elegans]|jgi:hypothetical protein|uniref:DUF6268 family outer membrane beta-barrel protein n=1 Tax=Eisenibacter elegans TaxID=997 RepID=UPI0004789962|nr:DUF6268 family outer membrane beta-barrel protein [Eisenibacter elegans]
MKKCLLTLLLLFLAAPVVFAQDDDDDFDDFDPSLYEATEKIRAFCGPKVLDISPQKLISVGYDFQGPNRLTAAAFDGRESEEANVRFNHGLRIGVFYPVISKNSMTLNLGFNYMRTNYVFDNADQLSHPLNASLRDNGLNSLGVNFTLFKPLDAKNFIVFQGSANLNGDYSLSEFQSLEYTRVAAAVVYGRKPNDRLQWGIGASRTYLGGALNYLPVVMYNYTAPSRKWGTEILFPARVNFRRTFNNTNLLMLGYEFEGQTYRLNNRNGAFNSPNTVYDQLELRRAEVRIRFTYEFAVKNYYWMSLQAGYRLNWSFEVDSEGDFYRSLFGDKPFLMENNLTNPFYMTLSINLVSP